MASVELADEDLVAHWHGLSSGVLHIQRRLDRAVEDAGVPSQFFAVLHLLLRAEGHRMPMSGLAREMSMTSGGFTKLADRMARDGLIDRRGSADDRRVVNAALTDDGLAKAEQAVQVFQDALRQCLATGVVAVDDLAAAAATMRVLGESHPPDTVVEAPEAVTAERSPTSPERRSRPR